MKNIKRWFENDTINSDQHYDICECEGHLEAKTDSALFMQYHRMMVPIISGCLE